MTIFQTKINQNNYKMKQLLLLAMMSLIMVSCQKTYISVMDTYDGELLTIRDSKHITKVGDTLIIASILELNRGYEIYGKYIGVIPDDYEYMQRIATDSVTRTLVFEKVVRIR